MIYLPYFQNLIANSVLLFGATTLNSGRFLTIHSDDPGTGNDNDITSFVTGNSVIDPGGIIDFGALSYDATNDVFNAINTTDLSLVASSLANATIAWLVILDGSLNPLIKIAANTPILLAPGDSLIVYQGTLQISIKNFTINPATIVRDLIAGTTNDVDFGHTELNLAIFGTGFNLSIPPNDLTNAGTGLQRILLDNNWSVIGSNPLIYRYNGGAKSFGVSPLNQIATVFGFVSDTGDILGGNRLVAARNLPASIPILLEASGLTLRVD
ncbi:MAG: hypothetical protein ACRC78_02660 [Planktothrix sp.]